MPRTRSGASPASFLSLLDGGSLAKRDDRHRSGALARLVHLSYVVSTAGTTAGRPATSESTASHSPKGYLFRSNRWRRWTAPPSTASKRPCDATASTRDTSSRSDSAVARTRKLLA